MNGDAIVIPFLPLLLALYVLTAVASYLLRAWVRWVALGGAALAALLALGIWQVDFSLPLWVLPTGWSVDLAAPLTRFGYTFQLQPANSPVVAMNLLIAAGALLLSARERQPANLPALTWVLLAGYTLLAVMTAGAKSPSLSAPIFLIMLAAIGVFVLQGGRNVNPAGPLRTLAPPILAALLFLIAAWCIDQMPLNPQDVALRQTAGALLGFGLILLLTPFPLHSAMPSTAQTAAPPAMLLITLLHPLAVLHLTATVQHAFPFVVQQTDWPTWLSWLGMLTAVWGGFAAVGAQNAGRLWGYAALHDWGLIILVLATPGLRSWTLVLFLYSLRSISMYTAAAGLATLEQTLGRLDLSELRGVGARLPWNSAAFLLGGLGLAGFPLTAGFAGHWAALLMLAETDWRPAVVVLVASAGAVVGFVRLARIMFGNLENRSVPRERTFPAALALSALAVTILVAVAPQLLSDFVLRALAAFG